MVFGKSEKKISPYPSLSKRGKWLGAWMGDRLSFPPLKKGDQGGFSSATRSEFQLIE
jgi:hypothetical protein